MNKNFLIVFLLLMPLCVLAAQEETRILNFSIGGEVTWVPFVYRADMDAEVSELRGEGPGMGVGSSGVGLNLGLTGKNSDGTAGLELRTRPNVNDNIFRVHDNVANIWLQPVDMFRVVFGMYQWNEMQGKVGGENVFQGLGSDTFGTLFIIRPPSSVPDAFKGFTLYGSFGISGWLDSNNFSNFAARGDQFAKYVFSTPHAGIAYRNNAFGLARFQFIGSNYMWGTGMDWAARNTATNLGGGLSIDAWLPSRVRTAAQLELAVNLTFIPNVNLDIGFNMPLPVTVVGLDGTVIDPDDPYVRGMPVGPTFKDLGYRDKLPWIDNTQLATLVNDIWQPPFRVSAGITYKPGSFPDLNLEFVTKLEFGEYIWFFDGSETFKAGMNIEANLAASYIINSFNRIKFNSVLKSKLNDNFFGQTELNREQNEMAVKSINRNSRIDLELGGEWTRNFQNSSLTIGFRAALPVGGDRYFWSDEGNWNDDDEKFYYMLRKEHTDAFRKGNLIITIPVIFSIQL